jgi:hypothetical protein
LGKGFETLWVGYLAKVNDNNSRRLSLGMKTLDGGTAKPDAREHRQCNCVLGFHGIPPCCFSLREIPRVAKNNN